MSAERDIYPDFSGEIPPQPLEDKEIEARLQGEISKWELVKSPRPDNPNKIRKELYQEFSFNDFNEVVEFLNEAKVVCDILPHHPRIENVWATLDVYLSTWAIGYNISYKDVQLAKNLDKIYEDRFQRAPHPKTLEKKANEDFFNELKTQIALDELDVVFSKIEKFYILNSNKKTPMEFTLLKGQYSNHQKSLIEGLSTSEDIKKERNVLRKGLVLLIESLMKGISQS